MVRVRKPSWSRTARTGLLFLLHSSSCSPSLHHHHHSCSSSSCFPSLHHSSSCSPSTAPPFRFPFPVVAAAHLLGSWLVMEEGKRKYTCVFREEGEGEKRRRLLVIRRSHVEEPSSPQLPLGPNTEMDDDHPSTPRPGRLVVKISLRGCTSSSGNTSDDGLRRVLSERRRLVLVLDLDHTLLHSVRLHRLSPEERVLLHRDQEGGQQQQQLLFNNDGYVTKLRPFVHEFLKEASSMYHLRVCTMGGHTYSGKMVSLLDPKGIFFSYPSDVVSREDHTHKGRKGLDSIRLGDQRISVVLDDTESVWENHPGNLVLVPPYHFFSSSRRKLGSTWCPPSESGEDESTGVLSTTLHLLRCLHIRYFDQLTSSHGIPDVRKILTDLQQH